MARKKTFQQKIEEFEELRKLAHERINTFTRFQLKRFLAARYADRIEQSFQPELEPETVKEET